MNKSCGGCKYFVKWVHDKIGGNGMCDLLDWRTKSDSICKQWKGIKYNRKSIKLEDINE